MGNDRQLQRLVQILRKQAQAAEFMAESGSKAVPLMEQAIEEMAELSNEVDESAITQVTLLSRENVEGWKELVESWHRFSNSLNKLAEEKERTSG